jgi:hypothetical protein
MSRYLSHLAALTLNQLEPLQPRLASRFETQLDRGPFDNNGLDVASESRLAVPSVPVQPLTVTASPAAQKNVTASADVQAKKETRRQDQPKVVERTDFMIKQSESTGDKQKLSSGQGFASVDTENASRAVQSATANTPVTPVSYQVRNDMLPTESIRTVVERVQERFTETTHNELVIKEVAASDTRQKTTGLEESQHPAPVKPASIVVRTEQSTAGANAPSQAGTQQMLSAQLGTEATPAPTIQVTIGRIEIRATQVADKPVAKPRSASTTMSLDDYLKQRGGGRV